MSNDNSSNYNNYDLQHHSMARKYALNLIDSVLKHKENGAMSSEIRDIARQRYNLDGVENERMLHNIVRNIAYDPRFEREDFIDPRYRLYFGFRLLSRKNERLLQR